MGENGLRIEQEEDSSREWPADALRGSKQLSVKPIDVRRRRYGQGQAYSSRCVYEHRNTECDIGRRSVSEDTRSGYNERGHVGAG